MPFVEVVEAALTRSSSIEQFRNLAAGNAAELAQIAPGLRRVFPNLPIAAELPTAQVRRYLFQSLFDFIARLSRVKPLVLLLDDLHWADESTLAMVNFLARRVEHLPVLVIATYRDEELDASATLNRTLEELIRTGIGSIKLEGLPRQGVAQMIAGLSRRQPPGHLIELIFEETQGNPFFVEEVYNNLAEEGMIFGRDGEFVSLPSGHELTVPQNLRLVIGRRLDRLSENAREVLSVAAVIGQSFSFMLLEAVVGALDPDALLEGFEEVQHAGFITASTQGPEAPFAFAHELVRQTLIRRMSQPREQRLHLKTAQAMEQLFPARVEERAAEIVYHLIKSGPYADSAKVAHYLSLLGQSLLRAGALEDARLTFAKALQSQETDVATRARILADLACAERGLGDWNAAIGHLRQSIDLYADAGDLRSIGRIVFEMVESFVWTGDFREAVEFADRGLSHLRGDEPTYQARLLSALGYIRAAQGQYSSAMQAYKEALASPAVGPFLARVLAYRSVCHCNFMQLDEALFDAQKSASLSNPEASPWTHTLALSIMMRAHYCLGRPGQALKIAVDLEPLARGAGQLAALSFCASIEAWADFARNPRIVILDQRIRDAVSFHRETSLSLFLAQSLGQMSLVRFLAGDWDEATAIAEEARTGELHQAFAGFAAGMLLRLSGYSGDRERVLELFDQARAHLPVLERPNPGGSWSLLMEAVESLSMVDEHGRAAELYPQVRELLSTGAVCMTFGCRFLETTAGIAAGAGGNWDLAGQHFERALNQAAEFPHRLEEAEVQRLHAMMLLRCNRPGDRERARGMLTSAADSYENIGMPQHLKLTRALLKKIGH